MSQILSRHIWIYRLVAAVSLVSTMPACRTATPLAEPTTPSLSTQLPTVTSTAAPSPTAFATPVAGATPDITVNPAQSIGTSPEIFGINGWWTDEDADVLRQRYAELSPRVVRVPVFQQVLEPVNDNENPGKANHAGFLFDTPIPVLEDRHLTYRRWFEMLRDQDVTLMVYIPYLAQWLSRKEGTIAGAPYPPTNLDEYAEFVRALLSYLVKDLDYPAEKIILEPVNEPDLGCGHDPSVPCFWSDWQMSDLAEVLRASYQQAKAIDPGIRIAGPALCCRGNVLDQLMREYAAADIFDILTYHKYDTTRFNLDPMLNMARAFQAYGKPVILSEYGNTIFTSIGVEGALWHAVALGELWKAGIAPIQFSISEWPGMHEGYNEMGLMTDWRTGWQTKPAFAVYANFFQYMPGTNLVALQVPEGFFGVAGIHPGERTLALWLTNGAYQRDDSLVIKIENWDVASATVQVFDNLAGTAPVDSFRILAGSDGSLVFDFPFQTEQSYLFWIAGAQ